MKPTGPRDLTIFGQCSAKSLSDRLVLFTMVILRGETTPAERTAMSAERSPDATPRFAPEGAPGLFAHESFELEAAV